VDFTIYREFGHYVYVYFSQLKPKVLIIIVFKFGKLFAYQEIVFITF